MNKKKKITIWIILLVIAIVTMLGGLIFLILNIKDDDSTKVYNDDNKYNNEPYDFDYYHIRDIGNDTVSLGNHGKMVIKHFDDGEEYHFYDKNNNELKVTGDNLGVHYRFYGYDRIRMHLIAYYLKNNEYYKDEFLIYSDHVEVKSIKNDMQKRVAYYDSNLREDMLWEQRIAGSIDAGLSSEQIIPYMQAQVDNQGNILGVEFLARWMHPTEGFLKPRRFLPTLEKNGYVVKLDQYMWERACRTIKRWERDGWDDLYISVNISPADFFFIDVVESLRSLVELYEVEPSKLRLEITENAMIYNSKVKIDAIERLREIGFLVEIDDFGSGFSSLNMLKDTPIDVIKIDMAFLDETRSPQRAKQILESMISLAKRLDLPVITEGVETAEQLEYLTEMGCDMFQGYYFAKALPKEEFEERYLRSGQRQIIKDGGKNVLHQ